MLGTARDAENRFFYAALVVGRDYEWSKFPLKLGFLLEVGVNFMKTSD